jgi:hypothetical protein
VTRGQGSLTDQEVDARNIWPSSAHFKYISLYSLHFLIEISIFQCIDTL